MRNGMRCWLAVLAALVAAPLARAGDDAPPIMMKVRVIRVDDTCFERLQCALRGDAKSCCAEACCPATCKSCPDGACCPTKAKRPCESTCDAATCCSARNETCKPASIAFPSTISACQCQKLISFVEGDRRATIVSSPTLVTLAGQSGTIQCAEQRSFITNVCNVRVQDRDVAMPVNEFFTAGMQMTLRPSLTPDRSAFILHMNAELSDMDSATPALFPVTTIITPEFEGGARGQPIPFTQFIQQPSTTTRGFQRVMGVPAGQTALVYAGRRTTANENCCEVPILCELPIVGDLFRCKTSEVHSDHLLVLVTPEVVEERNVQATPPCFDLPIMCDEAVAQAAFRVEECVPIAPKPVCATAACAKSCPTASAPCCTAPCPQAVNGKNVTGVWCPADCPCPGACPCPTSPACCPLTCALPAPALLAAPCAFVLVPMQQMAWHAMPVGIPCGSVASAPRAIHWTQEEEQSARPASNPQLAKLLAKYQKACDAGDTGKARKLATKCLLIDPTCFSK